MKEAIDKEQVKRIKAANALVFLKGHPAFCADISGDSLFEGAWFSMIKCCKNSMSEASKMGVTIFRGDKGWTKYKDRFEEEYKDELDEEFQSIEIPYEEKYGEPWKFDHMEYWCETSFLVYEGNPYSSIKEHYDIKKWGRYSGPNSFANTFEDMLIDCAKKVKKCFGSFDEYKDFRLPEEIRNHKENEVFHMKPITKGKHKGCSEMIHNKEHVDIYSGLVNLRWLKWFIETDYCKKNWGYHMKDFKKHIKRLDKVPKKRLEILKKYK